MPTTTAAEARADSYGLLLPPGWAELPLEPEAYQRFAEEAVTASVEQTEADAQAAVRRRLELLFRYLRGDIDQARVMLAATSIEVLDDDAEPEPGQALALSLTISGYGREEMKAPIPIRVPSLARAMSGAVTRETRDGRRIDLQPPSVVQFDAGQAVRLVRVEEIGRGVLATSRLFVESFLVPHDAGERVCVVQFATPNLPYARDLSQLFNAIAATLRIFHPGEETSFAPRSASQEPATDNSAPQDRSDDAQEDPPADA